MFKAYKYRIYPTKSQIQIIERHFGHCRYVFNWALEQKIQAFEQDNNSLSQYDLSGKLTRLKKESNWLYQTNSQSLDRMLNQVESAFNSFFKKKSGFSKYKTKKELSQSFQVPQRYKVDFINKTVWIPKVGTVKTKFHRVFDGIKKTMTVSRTPTGKYYISILVDDQKEFPDKQLFSKGNTIGIDMGIKYFAVFSSGEKIENPKYLRRSIKKLKVLQKRLSRKQKGSSNRRKTRAKLALLYEKISNQRSDFQHKLSQRLISENQAIAVETLNVAGLRKNHKLAQAISDASWSSFISKLEYKALWYGKTLLQIGTFEPSSKMCNICGYLNSNLGLMDRDWTCPVCKTTHDRDINAAVNIKNMALLRCGNSPVDSRVEPVDSFSVERNMKQEEIIV